MFKIKKVIINKSGFTLVETLIYLAIIGVVVTSFVSFGISIMEARNKNLAAGEVRANAREALSFMTQKIRNCQDIASPAENEAGEILALDMPDDAGQMVFYTENGTLFVSSSGSTQFMTSNQVDVSNLQFLRAGSGSVKINFTIKFRDDDSRDFHFSEDVETAATMRRLQQ